MSTSPNLTILPDTPAARLLAELTSYSDDLSEAAAAIEQALEAGSQSPLWQPLTSHAVVAYTRAFGHSNVRPGLLKHIDVPEDLVETHEMIRVYRNTTIAHSQSELSMSLPWVSLTPEGTVDRVVPFTIHHQLPPSTAARIAGAIDRVSDLVIDLIRPLAEQLTLAYRNVSADTVAGWPAPEVVGELAADFTGDSKRQHRPRFVAYWEIQTESPEIGAGKA